MAGTDKFFLVGLAAMLGVYAAYVIRRQYIDGDFASPLAMYSSLMIIHFSVPALFLALGNVDFIANPENSDYAVQAVLLAFLTFLAFHFGYALRANTTGKPSAQTLEYRWSGSKLVPLLVVFSILGWLTRIYVIAQGGYFQIDRTSQGGLEGDGYAIVRMLELFPLHVLYISTIQAWIPGVRDETRWRMFVLLSGAFEWLYWLPTGRKEEVIMVLLVPMIIRYLLTKRLPSRATVGTLAVALAVFFTVSFAYRNALEETQKGGSASIGTIAVEALQGAQQTDAPGDATPASIMLGRLSLIEPVAACIRLISSGAWEPWIGESYVYAIYSVVPRFLWPSKPFMDYGTRFGIAAGMVGYGDSSTSISVTFIGESYLNFGWLGVPLFALIGAFYCILYYKSKDRVQRQTWTLVYVMSFPALLYAGGAFAGYFGALMKIIPFYYFIGVIVTDRSPLIRTAAKPNAQGAPQDFRYTARRP